MRDVSLEIQNCSLVGLSGLSLLLIYNLLINGDMLSSLNYNV